MSLNEELKAFREESDAETPADVLKMMQAAQLELEKLQIADNAKRTGDKMEPFELPDSTGNKVALADNLKDGPVVISFYRGGWCPYCNMELNALQRHLPEIKGLGAQLIAVTPEVPDKSQTTIETNELEFQVLSDVGNTVATRLGLVFELAEELRPIYKEWGIDLTDYNGDEKYELPIPSTFVVDTDGTIVYAYHDLDYTSRMEPEDLLNKLKDLQTQR